MTMAGTLIETVGWLATAVFTMSFLFKDVIKLRALQIGGALLWLCYGLLIGSQPVVVANVLVVVVAVWTTVRYAAARPT
ncbi:MAG TPA: YgjV family protein [Woeseiaceae bacterium]|nr:YgjV family protein [Woeseiaceae bacterium]